MKYIVIFLGIIINQQIFCEVKSSHAIYTQNNDIVLSSYDKKTNNTIIKIVDENFNNIIGTYILDGFRFKRLAFVNNNELYLEGFLDVGINAVIVLDKTSRSIKHYIAAISKDYQRNYKNIYIKYNSMFQYVLLGNGCPSEYFWLNGYIAWIIKENNQYVIQTIKGMGNSKIAMFPDILPDVYPSLILNVSNKRLAIFESWFDGALILNYMHPQYKNKIICFEFVINDDMTIQRNDRTIDLNYALKDHHVKCKVCKNHIICCDTEIKTSNCKLWIFNMEGKLKAETNIRYTLKQIVTDQSETIMVGLEEEKIIGEWDELFEPNKHYNTRSVDFVAVDLKNGQVIKRINLENRGIDDYIVKDNRLIAINRNGDIEIWSLGDNDDYTKIVHIEW